MQKISKIIATVFFIGYSPLASGTVASLAALALYVLVKGTLLYFFLTPLLIILGFWSSGRALKQFAGNDPHEIVIDEFSSMFLVYLFIPFSIKLVIIGFLLYRIFDVSKIPPIKRLEKLPGSLGIMLDDIASAIFTNLILQILNFSLHPLFA